MYLYVLLSIFLCVARQPTKTKLNVTPLQIGTSTIDVVFNKNFVRLLHNRGWGFNVYVCGLCSIVHTNGALLSFDESFAVSENRNTLFQWIVQPSFFHKRKWNLQLLLLQKISRRVSKKIYLCRATIFFLFRFSLKSTGKLFRIKP